MTDPAQAATLDRLALIVRRSAIYPDERADVAFALSALNLNPADDNQEHPLLDLYCALHLTADSNGMVYLSAEHQQWLSQVLEDFGRKP